MELIYPYVRDRQLCSRAEFAALHPSPVIVFKKVQSGGQGETQLAPMLTEDLAKVARVLRHEAHQYRLVQLAPPQTLTVGRATENALTLTEDSVSRKHAQIVVDERGVTVTDLGSDNGTWIGTTRLAAPTLLQDGDRVSFGKVTTHYLGPNAFFDFLATLLDPRAAPGHA